MNSREINKVQGTLFAYLHPDLLLEPHKSQVRPGQNFKKADVEKYEKLILSISWFLRKISRYETFFTEFYSQSENIKNHEALEHHIHAYLEDIETLRNKLRNYIGSLKNDLKKIALNPKEIVNVLDDLNTQIDKVFENVSKHRGDHRHMGYKFVDSNINSAEMAENMLAETNPLRDQLTPEGIEHFKKQRETSFEAGKKYWTENAKQNFPQIEGATNEILEKTKILLFGFLDIEEIDIASKTE